MKRYVIDFIRTMWLMGIVAISSAYGIFYAASNHHLFAMGLFGVVFSGTMCLWAPYLEENFKLRHSSTKTQALAFGVMEMLMYSWQVSAGFGMFFVCRIPMLLMHSASSLCYFHNPNKRMLYFWLINHTVWNITTCIKPTLLFKGAALGIIKPTALTVFLMLFWGTSAMFKLLRKKEAASC